MTIRDFDKTDISKTSYRYVLVREACAALGTARKIARLRRLSFRHSICCRSVVLRRKSSTSLRNQESQNPVTVWHLQPWWSPRSSKVFQKHLFLSLDPPSYTKDFGYRSARDFWPRARARRTEDREQLKCFAIASMLAPPSRILKAS